MRMEIINFHNKDKERKFRSNSIFTFSKKVSFNSINSFSNSNTNNNKGILKQEENNNKLRNSSNTNTQQKEKDNIFENIKIDINISSSSHEKIPHNKNIKSNKGKDSFELPKSKPVSNINNNISSLLYDPDNLNIFNENNLGNNIDDISRNDLLFQYIDNTSNKRNILPDTDFLLANYSVNPTFKRKVNMTPERILDAPNLVDDYYLNLLEWGASNILAVALGPENVNN